MTLKEQIMKLQTYKMHEGEDTVYVERDDVLKALEQQQPIECENAISREAAIDIVKHECGEWKGLSKEIVKQFNGLPPVQPKYNPDEWCHNCSEYDHDKHCCPRFNRVIRNTVEEIKQSCEETISRSETIKYLNTNMAWYDEDGEMADSDEKLKAITNLINGVPSVKSKPKMGHWMWNCSIIPSTPVSPEEIDYCGWVCSECKQFPDDNDWDDPDEPPHYRYCPNCGCPMESE